MKHAKLKPHFHNTTLFYSDPSLTSNTWITHNISISGEELTQTNWKIFFHEKDVQKLFADIFKRRSSLQYEADKFNLQKSIFYVVNYMAFIFLHQNLAN